MEIIKKNPVIFIVSGKANSGKDTTCELIDNYIKLKEQRIVNLQISYYIKMYARVITEWDGKEDTKPRSLLQQLGTEIIRNKIDKEFFIKRIIGDINVYSYYCDVITISDARFPEEIEALDKTFDKVIKLNVERPNYENNLNSNEKKHSSETALNNYNNYDYRIINDGTIDDLNKKIKLIIDEVLI